MRHSIRRPFMWVFLAVGGVVLAAALAFLFGLVVMALWNWLMPEIFGIRAISYWEAWGLVLLAHILFKAGRWDHGRERHDRAREEEWKERFRRRFKDRFFRGEGTWAHARGAKPEESGGGAAKEPPQEESKGDTSEDSPQDDSPQDDSPQDDSPQDDSPQDDSPQGTPEDTPGGQSPS